MAKVKFGLIGTGGRGIRYVERLAGFLKEEGEFIALSDIDEERLNKMAEKLGGKFQLFTNYHKLLALKELDAVVIATPDVTHEMVVVDALNAEKHIICEKPLAITADGCNKVAAAAAQAKKIVQLGLVLRYAPFSQKLKEIISSGAIGKLKIISMLDYYSDGMTYFRRWNRLKKNSGGLLVHKGCHAFDILNWLIDARPVRVFASGGLDVFRPDEKKPQRCMQCAEKYICTGSSYLRPGSKNVRDFDLCLWNSEKDTQDNDIVIIDYANGVRATYTECLFPVRTTHQFSIVGDRGEIEADRATRLIKVHSLYEKDVVTHEIGEEEGHGGGDRRLFEDFFTALREGRQPLADIEAGRMSALIGLAAEQSIEENRIIDMKALMK